MSDQNPRPIALLIAALGGEGGGVLTDWIVSAAMRCGFPVQSTSIPGVAQRTGATTYYIEFLPLTAQELGGKQPILALAPGVGDIDIVLASELLEAGRCIAAGFVTPDRTTMIASTSRSYLVVERMAMGDGRLDSARLAQAVERNAKSHLLVDMEALAQQSGAMINAVMLGLIAGSGRLPIALDAFETAIRADGKAIEATLKGFRAGLDAARSVNVARATPAEEPPARGPSPALPGFDPGIAAMPAAARAVIGDGVRRLVEYQDEAYGQLYLDRLAAIRAADERARMDGRLLREVARHLALRMSYEDVIRVAEVKIDPARMAQIAAEIGARPGEPFTVTEFLKPGVDEMCSILPPWLAKRILPFAERRGWTGRLHWGMEVNTASITGFLRFWLLAKLRRWRPKSYRFAEEQRAIDAWLALIQQAAQLSGDLALEVAECARLIKGYGDTHKRGTTNYQAIEAQVIRPVLAGQIALHLGADAVASARVAALADPDGEALARCLERLSRQNALGVAAE